MTVTPAQLEAISQSLLDGQPDTSGDGSRDQWPWRCSLDLLSEPPSETAWLLEGLIPSEAVILFSGREGTLKTWLALDWARTIAEGSVWQGRTSESGSVLYLDAEMPGELFRSRLHSIGGSKNLNVWRWQDLTFPSALDHPDLRQAAKTHRLIVVDTLKRFMQGLDENSSDDMAKLTGMLRELTRHGATVLALHHAPKDPEKRGYRGSTELGAGVDITLTIEKKCDEGAETLILTAPKTRYTETPRLALRVTRGKNRPEFTTVDGTVEAEPSQTRSQDLENLQKVIATLAETQGVKPNQTQVIGAAKNAKLASSRKTVLGWLREGEGRWWTSQPDGRSRLYEPVHLSPLSHPPGPEQVDNGTDRNQSQCEVIEDAD